MTPLTIVSLDVSRRALDAAKGRKPVSRSEKARAKSVFDVCMVCGHELIAIHAHNFCPSCGTRDSCYL